MFASPEGCQWKKKINKKLWEEKRSPTMAVSVAVIAHFSLNYHGASKVIKFENITDQHTDYASDRRRHRLWVMDNWDV